jgi:asparagine synthase (glutamine-hydrolysing)
MFDVETLCRAVREAQLGVGDAYSWDRVNSSLALVVWLEQLDRGPGTGGAAMSLIADA